MNIKRGTIQVCRGERGGYSTCRVISWVLRMWGGGVGRWWGGDFLARIWNFLGRLDASPVAAEGVNEGGGGVRVQGFLSVLTNVAVHYTCQPFSSLPLHSQP